MAFWYYEGTRDFLVSTYPALLLTFRASGSITAGQGVAFDGANTSDVYVPTTAVDTTKCVGVCVNTVASGDPADVCVFGVMKNLTSIGQAKTPGMAIGLSGSSGAFAQALASGSSTVAGTVLSGSTATGTFMALINCMK